MMTATKRIPGRSFVVMTIILVSLFQLSDTAGYIIVKPIVDVVDGDERTNGEVTTKSKTTTTKTMMMARKADEGHHHHIHERRTFLRNIRRSCATVVAASSGLLLPPPNDDNHRVEAKMTNDAAMPLNNLLTNPFLEQLRIWNQAEADQLKYGGELAPGDAGNRGKVQAYTKLLVPILQIADDIDEVDRLVRTGDVTSWKQAEDVLRQPQYDPIRFKKIFNAYGDNIYYSDPDRANLYLGGGATPRSEQSMAYLLRNDVLNNVEGLIAELAFLLRDTTPQSERDHPDDLYLYATSARTAMGEYLKLVPPEQFDKAREMMKSL